MQRASYLVHNFRSSPSLFPSFPRDDTPIYLKNVVPDKSLYDQVSTSRAVMTLFYLPKLCPYPAVCSILSKKPTRRPDPTGTIILYWIDTLLDWQDG